MKKSCEFFSGRIAEAFKGTSLDGATIEVLTYREDGEFIVAIDVIGRPCSAMAKANLLSYLRSHGLSNIEIAGEDIVSPEDGIRVYSVCNESAFLQLSNRGE